ncbi:MAG: DUF3047 domain-containing protein [candidate division NC10 bacterium]
MARLVRELMSSIGWFNGVFILTLCLVPGGALGVQEVVIVDFGQERNGVPPGWELMEKTGKAELSLVEDGNGRVLRLRSNSSSFAIQKEVDIDLKQTPFLEWQWKVTEMPRRGDFRNFSTDDQAAQLYLVFTPDFMQKEVIAYIWDSNAPKGITAEPTFQPVYPFLRIKVVVLESGEAEKGKWITETRNVVEDYRKLYGGHPGKIAGIRIQINSQHTKSRSEAYWRYLKVKGHP